MDLFFNQDLQTSVVSFEANSEDINHFRALRIKAGDKLRYTNGVGLLFECELSTLLKRKAVIRVLKAKKIDKPIKNLHLAVALTKQNERFEWLVEKTTELGIGSITPIYTKRTSRNKINIERLKKTAISAIKQSKQIYLPIINSVTKFEDFIRQSFPMKKYIAYCDAFESIDESLIKTNDLLVIIGPEGGFAKEEIALSKRYKFNSLFLGDTILRTETAGVAVCSYYNLGKKNSFS